MIWNQPEAKQTDNQEKLLRKYQDKLVKANCLYKDLSTNLAEQSTSHIQRKKENKEKHPMKMMDDLLDNLKGQKDKKFRKGKYS